MKEPRGFRNFNPGNVIISSAKWVGKVEFNSDGKFEQFDTMEHGLRCMLIVLRTYIKKRGLNTIEKIIPVYAPSSENNCEAYIETVCVLSGFLRDAVIGYEIEDMRRLIEAMCYHENGRPLPKGCFDRAWKLL
jgi:hypothetical protein